MRTPPARDGTPRPASATAPTRAVTSDLLQLPQASWRHVRTERMQHILKVQAAISRAVREHLDGAGFTELVPPILGPVTDPGIRGAKQASVDYYGHEYKIMSSAILYKQMMATAMGKVYFFSPNVRFEPLETATTGRHLVEFIQVDLEIPHGTYHDAMDTAEGLLQHVTKRVPETAGAHLEALGVDLADLTDVTFPRLTHAEAVDTLQALGHAASPSAEISWAHEKILSDHLGTPFFIHDYPKGSRGFYDMEDPERPGILRDFDMLYDGGFGEAVSGAEREHTYAKVVARMRETGEDPAKYGWYLDMLREGIAPSAGFGIGLERLTRYVCKLESILEARPYPKIAGVVSP
ncbi:MAG: asparagine synthetase A [Euryarchaeota archaeon]|nr:asparagine synthetase A [Euryarchaeota archaeon]